MKKTLLFVLFLNTNCCGQSVYDNIFHKRDTGSGVEYDRAILKDLELCKCIMYYLKTADFRKDASVSLLYDLGKYEAEGYMYIDSVAKDFVDSLPYSNLTENKGMLLHCIDYYNSGLLKQEIIYADRYLPK